MSQLIDISLLQDKLSYMVFQPVVLHQGENLTVYLAYHAALGYKWHINDIPDYLNLNQVETLEKKAALNLDKKPVGNNNLLVYQIVAQDKGKGSLEFVYKRGSNPEALVKVSVPLQVV